MNERKRCKKKNKNVIMCCGSPDQVKLYRSLFLCDFMEKVINVVADRLSRKFSVEIFEFFFPNPENSFPLKKKKKNPVLWIIIILKSDDSDRTETLWIDGPYLWYLSEKKEEEEEEHPRAEKIKQQLSGDKWM